MGRDVKPDLRDVFVSKQEFGRVIGVSPNTVNKMINKGQVETERQGDLLKVNLYRYRKQVAD